MRLLKFIANCETEGESPYQSLPPADYHVTSKPNCKRSSADSTGYYTVVDS